MLLDISNHTKEFTDTYLYYFNNQRVRYVHEECIEELLQTFLQVVDLYPMHSVKLSHSVRNIEVILKSITSHFTSGRYFIFPFNILKESCEFYGIPFLESNYCNIRIQFVVFNVCLSICRTILDIHKMSVVLQEGNTSDYLYSLKKSFGISTDLKILLKPIQLSFNRNVCNEYRKWSTIDLYSL